MDQLGTIDRKFLSCLADFDHYEEGGGLNESVKKEKYFPFRCCMKY